MSNTDNLGLIFMGLVIAICQVSSLPDGAPESTCKAHRPGHGGKSQPLDTLPYLVQATGSYYKPNDTIAVRIKGKPGIYFKGFFLQASDDKGNWIGEFEKTPFSVSHPECAMATHAENKEKEEVTLIWQPPANSTGMVKFHASILKNYKLYWVDAPAIAPQSTISFLSNGDRRSPRTRGSRG